MRSLCIATREEAPKATQWQRSSTSPQCFFLSDAITVLQSLQSCLTLCDPIDGSPPGSPIPGIFQERVLEWVAISFSSAWKWKVKGKSLNRVRLLVTPLTTAYQAPPSMGFSRQEYWSGVPLTSPVLCLAPYIFYLHLLKSIVLIYIVVLCKAFYVWIAKGYCKCNSYSCTIRWWRPTSELVLLKGFLQQMDQRVLFI